MKSEIMKLKTSATALRATRRNQVWMIDIARLDVGSRLTSVMMVVDVHSRLPLSLTVSPAIAGAIAIATTLDRLVRRSGPLEDIWIYRDSGLELALRRWAKFHRIAITFGPMLKAKALTEPIFRDLGAFLRGNLFSTHAKLGLGLEKWRQSYAAAARPLPNAPQ
jgi:transposase InsO family protein